MKNISIVVSAISLCLLSAVPARAHAMLDHASPPVGSASPAAPHDVALWFTQDLEPAFSTIEVRNDKGALVSSGKAQVDKSDHRQLRVSVKSLPPGAYKVNWRVLSVDTHRTEGNFTFRVGP
jgi:methionine-rich copper-binding protein CopC